MTEDQNDKSAEKVWRLAESIRVGMLALHDGEGLSARPMYALIPDDWDAIWFITNRNSPKIAEVKQDADALLSFSGGENGEHLVMTGTVSVVDDRDKLKSLWGGGADMYFPRGSDDPAAVLLRFEPGQAEYWGHAGGNPVSFALKYAKAKLTGDQSGLREHARVSL